MSTPPVDPWSGQPEQDPTTYDVPAWPNDQPTSGGHPPYQPGWPAEPPATPTPPPGPYPTLPYGTPAAPTSPYAAPTNPYGTPAAPTSPYAPGVAPVSPYAPGAAPTGTYGGPPPGPGAFAPAPYPVAAPPPGRRPVSLAATLSIIGVLAVLLGGGGLTYFALAGEDTGGDRETVTPTASADPTGTTPAPTPSATPSTDPEIRLVTPETLAGRPKSTDAKLQKLSDELVREMKSKLSDDTGVVGAFYGSPDDRNMVMLVAASAFVLSPESELDDAIEGVTKDLSVTGMTAIAPGPLGGVAKCGDGKSADVSLGVCAWADHGSVGLVVVFFSSAAAAAAEFGTIRAAVELRD
ncbi:hypothetical protein [Micromonospora cathayae]|uniref:Flagellar basal body-associated protein FliL n=1 Tax=Micromonospora cathayae TaxID=3028804 RepID=A0ABY7ZX46_9ACTN|nr:hypothetical protein [Micromonospora sp. HUAS 3]WDZ87635.1 hypothetical protein PVK37_15100 [Micromonospora sp. HUAS 3]